MVNGELLVKLPSVKIDRFEGDNEYFGVDEAGFLVGRIKDRLKLVKLDTQKALAKINKKGLNTKI